MRIVDAVALRDSSGLKVQSCEVSLSIGNEYLPPKSTGPSLARSAGRNSCSAGAAGRHRSVCPAGRAEQGAIGADEIVVSTWM